MRSVWNAVTNTNAEFPGGECHRVDVVYWASHVRHYQLHLKICGLGNWAPQDLSAFGRHLLAQLDCVRFGFYEVRTTTPVETPTL